MDSVKEPNFFFKQVLTEEEDEDGSCAEVIKITKKNKELINEDSNRNDNSGKRVKKKVPSTNVTKIKRPQSVANVKRKPKWFPKINISS